MTRERKEYSSMRQYIRPAEAKDLSRIAEILVFDKRIHYRAIFRDDDVSFNVIQVLPVAAEYAKPEILGRISVYDDGIVRGMVRIEGTQVRELYVDDFFRNEGIGSALLEYAVREHDADHLWVLEKNLNAIRFYESGGFRLTSERQKQEGTEEFIVRMERKS